jgi:hypothetical protein
MCQTSGRGLRLVDANIDSRRRVNDVRNGAYGRRSSEHSPLSLVTSFLIWG